MLGMGMRTRTHAADIYLRDSDTDSEKDTATDTWLPLTSFHKMSRLEAVSTIFHFSAPPSALCSNYGWDGMGWDEFAVCILYLVSLVFLAPMILYVGCSVAQFLAGSSFIFS